MTGSLLEEHLGLEGPGPVQLVWAGQEVTARAVDQGGRGQTSGSRGLLGTIRPPGSRWGILCVCRLVDRQALRVPPPPRPHKCSWVSYEAHVFIREQTQAHTSDLLVQPWSSVFLDSNYRDEADKILAGQEIPPSSPATRQHLVAADSRRQ